MGARESPVGLRRLDSFDGNSVARRVHDALRSPVGLPKFVGYDSRRDLRSPVGPPRFVGYDSRRSLRSPGVRTRFVRHDRRREVRSPVGLTRFGGHGWHGCHGTRNVRVGVRALMRVSLRNPRSRWRRRRAPGKFEIVRSATADHQSTFMELSMMASAEGCHIANLVAAAVALISNMMQVQVPR